MEDAIRMVRIGVSPFEKLGRPHIQSGRLFFVPPRAA